METLRVCYLKICSLHAVLVLKLVDIDKSMARLLILTVGQYSVV